MVSFELGKEIKMFFVLSRAWDKEEILSPHEESNLRPSDSAFRCSTTEPQRLHGNYGNYGNFQKRISHTKNILAIRQGHSFISLKKFYRKGYEDLPPEELSVGAVVPLLVGSTSVLRPFIELTLNSPSFPSLAASLSVMITSCSFVAELNFSARSTMILPHLGTDIY